MVAPKLEVGELVDAETLKAPSHDRNAGKDPQKFWGVFFGNIEAVENDLQHDHRREQRQRHV